METYDVAIIGYGPTGAIAGNLLGLYHIRTVIIERETSIYTLPRAIVMDDEILRVFQYIGLIDAILPLTRALDGEEFLNSRRKALFTVKLASAYTSYASSNAFYQPQLEAVLRRGVERFSCVRTYVGYEVKALEQNEQGVVITMQPCSCHKQWQLQVRYVLGCDGARSITRLAAAIHLQDLKFHQSWLVIDALLKREDTALQTHLVQQYCHPNRPATYIPSVHNHRRWEFMLRADETPDTMLQPERIQALLAPWIDPHKLEIIRAATYTFHALIAQQWRKERLFLLGDAAHQMPPFTGQGMCAGIRDAWNLCWKLALVLRGQARSELLDSYQQERAPSTQANIIMAMLVGRLIQARQPLGWLRDHIMPLLARLYPFSLHMPPLTSGLLMQPSIKTHGRSSHASHLLLLASALFRQTQAQGTLLPQAPVRLPTGSLLQLDDITGPGFAVVALNFDPRSCLSTADLTFWDSLPASFIQLVSSASKQTDDNKPQRTAGIQHTTCVVDCEDSLAGWFTRQAGHIAIVRPDRYIFGFCTPHSFSEATDQLRAILC